MIAFDHIAIAATDLAQGTAWVEEVLGVPMQPGGKHDRYGTHNTLLGLGDLYLEVITLDPDAGPKDGPAWFGLDHFTGRPRPANWICRTDDFAPHAAVTGPPVALTRGDLHWQLTVPQDGSLPYGGAFPTLIQWGQGVPHPATTLTDQGCRLLSWTVTHPDAATVQEMLQIDDPRVTFETGPAGFKAVIDTPSGPRVLA